MALTELEEIKKYWTCKYPRVDIRLWANEFGTKYYGQMNSYESALDLEADTIGELINQGESFLRKYKS